MRKNIIWNINRICAYNCPICCVDAFYVKKNGSNIIVKSNSIENPIIVKSKSNLNNIFEEANIVLQEKKLELSIPEKKKIIDNIDIPITLDFSGGDPLILKENFEIISYASKKIGKNNISISTTGIGLSMIDIEKLKKYVSYIEFTYDFPKEIKYINRPNDYNNNNLTKIKLISQSGIKIGAQISLTKENISEKIIFKIYKDLNEANVDEIFLMKIFPVGRGSNLIKNEPTKEEYKKAINLYKNLENKFSFPKVVIQSILSYSENEYEKFKERYNMSDSLNINNLGMLSLSPWAYDEKGNQLSEYILGNLIENKLSELFNYKSYNRFYKKLNRL